MEDNKSEEQQPSESSAENQQGTTENNPIETTNQDTENKTEPSKIKKNYYCHQ